MKNKSLYEGIREKVIELGDSSAIIKYINNGNNQHEINITWTEEIDYELNNDVFQISKMEDANNE